MDQVASTLLAFPPTDASQLDDKAYDAAAKAHVYRLNLLKKEQNNLLSTHSAQLLQHVDPVLNSISALFLLHDLYVGHGKKPNPAEEYAITFLLKYDPRQIRYAGHVFREFLSAVCHGDHFPPTITVQLLSAALLRLEPTGTMFTSLHLPLGRLAYRSDNIEQALPFLTRPTVFYPGVRGQVEPRPLCNMRLPPSSYLTVESGLTSRVSSSTVLEYELLVGLCHLQLREFQPALAAFERVLTYPTTDHGCSKIMVEAYNKWVLVSLLVHGKVGSHPAVTQTVQATYTKVGRPYLNVAKAFEKPDNAAELKKEVETVGMPFWAEDGNEGLIRQVLRHYQPHHILRLRAIYSKLSIEDVRLLTQSGETGAQLKTAGEVEVLLRDMISTGMLRSADLAKPADNSAPGDGQGHLTFLPEEEELDEETFMEEMLDLKARVKGLEPIVQAANERLSTSRDFVRHLVKNERADRFGLAMGSSSAGGVRDNDVTYDSQIEDEDLMV